MTSKGDKTGLPYSLFCYIMHWILMLSSILNSERVIQSNIHIVRIFIKIRGKCYVPIQKVK